MQSVRKEEERHDNAMGRYDLKSAGWNMDPLSAHEFKLIHAQRPKNLVCKSNRVYSNKKVQDVKVIRQQTMELGGDEVRGEFCDYTIFAGVRNGEGDVIEAFRGFNQDLDGIFDKEDDSVLFVIRKEIRKCVIEFEHALTKWKQIRLMAKDRMIPFITKNLDKVDPKDLATYGLTTCSTSNISKICDSLADWRNTRYPSIEQPESHYSEAMNLIRIASIATPGMFVQEDVAFLAIGETLQSALVEAIIGTIKNDKKGFIQLHKKDIGP